MKKHIRRVVVLALGWALIAFGIPGFALCTRLPGKEREWFAVVYVTIGDWTPIMAANTLPKTWMGQAFDPGCALRLARKGRFYRWSKLPWESLW